MGLNEEFLNKLDELDKEKTREREMILGLKDDLKVLSSKLTELSHFRLRLAEDDTLEIRRAVNSSRAILDGINNLEIPDSITVKRQNTIEFRDQTRVVLVIFFLLSIVIVGGSVWWASKRTAEATELERKVNEALQVNYTQYEVDWLNMYFNHMNKKHPRDTKNFIKENPMPSVE